MLKPLTERDYGPAINVQVIANHDLQSLFRQTPFQSGQWQGVRFVVEPVTKSDYVIVLNHSEHETRVKCAPGRVWCVLQEPPNEEFGDWHRADAVYRRVFTQDVRLKGKRYHYSQPAIPWHVKRSYNFLKRCPPPDKSKQLSWVTSSIAAFAGHRARLAFLGTIKPAIEFDLYGRGFSPIVDKWDGLAPYQYSLAIENYSCPFYWTEKLADCFLAWTMPIYYGCTNIADFFPKESYISIDIHDPRAAQHLREIVRSDAWLKHRDAIAYARELVLDKYQFFPYFSALVRKDSSGQSQPPPAADVVIPGRPRPRLSIKKLFVHIQQGVAVRLQRLWRTDRGLNK